MKEFRTVGLGLGWDELKQGDCFKTIFRTITETDLVNFINSKGMLEVLFTDVEYAKKDGLYPAPWHIVSPRVY